MRRQERLKPGSGEPLDLWSIMDEAVLRRKVGGRKVMHGQLDRLIKAAEMPNVTLQVLPDDMGAHAGIDGPLTVIQFEGITRPTVYVGTQAGNLYQEKVDGIRRCQQVITRLLAAAPGPEQSLELIKRAAEEMKP
jgi:hypothetical protein